MSEQRATLEEVLTPRIAPSRQDVGCSPLRVAAVLTELLCGRIEFGETQLRLGLTGCQCDGQQVELRMADGSKFYLLVLTEGGEDR